MLTENFFLFFKRRDGSLGKKCVLRRKKMCAPVEIPMFFQVHCFQFEESFQVRCFLLSRVASLSDLGFHWRTPGLGRHRRRPPPVDRWDLELGRRWRRRMGGASRRRRRSGSDWGRRGSTRRRLIGGTRPRSLRTSPSSNLRFAFFFLFLILLNSFVSWCHLLGFSMCTCNWAPMRDWNF